MAMPRDTTNAQRLTANAKKPKFLLLVVSYWLLVLILSGCRVIGSTRPAALQVTSTPEASVFLDGKHLGKTPFFSDQLKSGEYTLKITVSEATYIERVVLTEKTLTVVNRELSNNFLAQSGETLWLVPQKKGLMVISMPSEAELTVDGALIGKTPLALEDLKEGEHKIGLSKAGYADREFSVKTSSKYQLVADVTLASLAAKLPNASPAPAPQVQKVEVTKTPQGFLRVRAEPSLSAPEIGRVKTGDSLEVVQEIQDWLKIKFEGKQGWISAQYTKKLP